MCIRGLPGCCRHWPAMAQSMRPVFLSTRKSTYHSPIVRTILSVVSKGGSGNHRIDMRVDICACGGLDGDIASVQWDLC